MDVADALERQKFWTEIMRAGGESTVNRLKASELLAKVQNDFSGASDYFSMGDGSVNLESLSDENLAQLINGDS